MIAIKITEDNFANDIYALLKAFYPKEEILVAGEFPEGTEERSFRLVIRYASDFISIENPDEPEECRRMQVDYGNRADTRNRLKILLYRLLQKRTGVSLPWGTLTGVRPTKIALHMLEEGKSPEQIRAFMEETYAAGKEKIDLGIDIAEREQKILDSIDYRDGYSLYIGIPFCPSTCLYCSFPSYPAGQWSGRMGVYLDALEQELDFVAEQFVHERLHTIYIGGGTPTALGERELERLLEMIAVKLDHSHLAEYTIEAGRPDSITAEKLRIIAQHDVGRISINPQTMNQRTLDVIGRHHTVDMIYRSFALAREQGFSCINMDLIMGLPGETIADVAYTLAEIEKLRPDNLTVHSLAIKRSARLNMEREHYLGYPIINSQEHIDLAAGCAAGLGMNPYYLYRQKNIAGNLENIGFALPGKEGLYNVLMMEEKQDIVACGAGSISKRVYPDGRIERSENVKDVEQYIARIGEMIERKRVLLEEKQCKEQVRG